MNSQEMVNGKKKCLINFVRKAELSYQTCFIIAIYPLSLELTLKLAGQILKTKFAATKRSSANTAL